MTHATREESFGQLSEQATVTFKRKLPGPIAHVWSYVTESDKRAKWLASGEMELRKGASFELVWKNDSLTTPPGHRPEGFDEEHRMTCEMLEIDPPHLISFTWGRSGGVTITLKEQGADVVLTLVHRRLPDRNTMMMVGAGWHVHLDLLAERLSATASEPFWDKWSRLRETYATRIPVDQ